MDEITAYHLARTDHPDLKVASLEEPDLTENEIVTYDDEGHTGVILEVRTEDFTWEADGEEHEVDASSENPVYTVALEKGGTGLFTDEDLDQVPEDDAFGDIDVDPVEEVEDAELGQAYANLDDCTDCVVEELSVNVPFAEDPGVGWADYPDSWEEADVPARIILLDMWSSVGASFRGCVREFTGKVRNPEKFCGATKDEVYGTTQWR